MKSVIIFNKPKKSLVTKLQADGEANGGKEA
jgi:hypothetical protein